MRRLLILIAGLGGALAALAVQAQRPTTAPSTRPATLPHLQIDVQHKQVRMECEAVNARAPLEFFVCAAGGAEHEAVLRSRAKASHLHLALLLIGLTPGEPGYVNVAGKRVAPRGPLLEVTCEFEKDGKTVRVPSHRLMRQIKTKKPLPPMKWVFAGSRLADDGRYAADATGYLLTVVNFDYSVIDVPDLRSSANESLEWEIDPEVVPKRDAPVWLIIEPAGQA
ncbi:MAG TPA: YdjY domain-containing protein, partial [Tepidisphaeraceae bacterium]|nr:YdjY domain-containing protein [Tepidisphaeraceae bacterium]